jgi:hypothetical protein
MKKLFIISIFLFITSCYGPKEVDKTYFQQNKTITAFSLNLNYSNSDINFKDKFPSSCFIHISKDSSLFPINNGITLSGGFNYKYSNDYIFLDDSYDDIYLSSVECSGYRVFYNKMRFKRTQTKILIGEKVKDKINYGGHIDIDWHPEIFKVSDLFILGHMMIGDDGDFVLKISDEYKEFLNFMESQFDIKADKIFNSANQELLKKGFIEIK